MSRSYPQSKPPFVGNKKKQIKISRKRSTDFLKYNNLVERVKSNKILKAMILDEWPNGSYCREVVIIKNKSNSSCMAESVRVKISGYNKFYKRLKKEAIKSNIDILLTNMHCYECGIHGFCNFLSRYITNSDSPQEVTNCDYCNSFINRLVEMQINANRAFTMLEYAKRIQTVAVHYAHKPKWEQR